MWMALSGIKGLPVKLKRCSISAHVEVLLNWSKPQEVRPFESGRETFTPWLSHWTSFSMSALLWTLNGTV
jgi:hypothetical protein